MSTTTEQSTNPSPAQVASPLALVVELDPADDNAMLRVLTLLARRRCSVTRAAFAPDPQSGCDLLSVELDAPRHLDRNLIAWVSALVPVRSVRPKAGGAPLSSTSTNSSRSPAPRVADEPSWPLKASPTVPWY